MEGSGVNGMVVELDRGATIDMSMTAAGNIWVEASNSAIDIDDFNFGEAFSTTSAVNHTTYIDGIAPDLWGTETYDIHVSTANAMKVHIGANADQDMMMYIGSVHTNSLGVNSFGAATENLAAIDLTTQTGSNDALRVIQAAIDEVSASRSYIGAVMNRLDYSIQNLQTQYENMSTAESRIRDADMALEITEFSRQQILVEAGTAMLAQANLRPEAVLELLSQ